MKTLWWPKADLMAWTEAEETANNPQRVYPGGGPVKCGSCTETVAALLQGEMSMVRGDERIVPGDWRPDPLTKAHLCDSV